MIEGGVNDDGDLIVSQIDFFLELIHLGEASLDVMDVQSFDFQSL